MCLLKFGVNLDGGLDWRSKVMCCCRRTHWWWWRRWWSRSSRRRWERAGGRGIAPSPPRSAGRRNACTASCRPSTPQAGLGQVQIQEIYLKFECISRYSNSICQRDTEFKVMILICYQFNVSVFGVDTYQTVWENFIIKGKCTAKWNSKYL